MWDDIVAKKDRFIGNKFLCELASGDLEGNLLDIRVESGMVEFDVRWKDSGDAQTLSAHRSVIGLIPSQLFQPRSDNALSFRVLYLDEVWTIFDR